MTALRGLKPSSFSSVRFLPTSYASVRCEPHARGGSHHPNYERDAKFLSILFPDVDRSNAIPVPCPATRLVRAGKDAPPWLALAAVTAHRTGTRRVVFVLEYHAHPQSLSLVDELVANRATRPLVDFLVIGGANISVLADISHIANHDGLDALMIQRRDKSRGAIKLVTTHQSVLSSWLSSVMHRHRATVRIS